MITLTLARIKVSFTETSPDAKLVRSRYLAAGPWRRPGKSGLANPTCQEITCKEKYGLDGSSINICELLDVAN